MFGEPATLIGSIDSLREIGARTEKEERLDILPWSNIVHDDLVFTLQQSPDKYYRPFVRPERDVLRVVGNLPFFRALKDAGVERVKFDIVRNGGQSLPLEALMERFGLEFAPEIVHLQEVERYLFFNQNPHEVDVSNIPSIRYGHGNGSDKFKYHQCSQYLLSTSATPMDQRELFRRVVRINGKIRSVDGIKDIEPYEEFFA